ncbi:MAG: HD-like signal output (HDOD) protein [Myxococcota bacterium]
MVATETRLDAALREAGELGLMPAAVVEIERVAQDPTSSLKDLETTVALDPMLTARILKFANTAQYGRTRTVTHLKQAVVALGMRAVRDVAIGMAVAARSNDVMREDAEHFIQHAVYTAVISTVMEVSGSQAANDAFVTGLLHNMGTLIMVHLDREKYAKLKAENPAENTARCMMEQVAYGFNHAELAAECLDRWGLPGRVVHAIRHHHDPRPRDKATALLTLADNAANQFLEGDRLGDIIQTAIDSESNRVLGIGKEKLNARFRQVPGFVTAFIPFG